MTLFEYFENAFGAVVGGIGRGQRPVPFRSPLGHWDAGSAWHSALWKHYARGEPRHAPPPLGGATRDPAKAASLRGRGGAGRRPRAVVTGGLGHLSELQRWRVERLGQMRKGPPCCGKQPCAAAGRRRGLRCETRNLAARKPHRRRPVATGVSGSPLHLHGVYAATSALAGATGREGMS